MVGASGGNGAAEGVDMLQLALLVATGRPFEFIQIHGIGNAKILKRAEVAFGQWLPADEFPPQYDC